MARIIYRFSVLLSLISFLWFAGGATIGLIDPGNPSPDPFAKRFLEVGLPWLSLAILAPVAVMATYYAIRWAITGKIRPWVPLD